MEGVGARLGRTSNRYGPSTVFTGPVRNWEKKWVNIPPPNSGHNHRATATRTDGSPHLFLYKWTPITPSQTKDSSISDNNGNADYKNSGKDDDVGAQEPQKKKFKYIPVIVLEEQRDEHSEQMEDGAKRTEIDPSTVETTSKNEEYDEKPDINEAAAKSNPVGCQDLNESTLDLSLGMGAHNGENEFDSKGEQSKDAQFK
ncbi:uncharacterized protein LOC127253452 [Andrographis paniculata]|uniref:uncharacterized protein LOC127253452 n=1 Tax=Andrographis paniculata TaxID=175694 RepID=UPI0021E6FDC9|nr:uncharacterized protein LOC127253452 [Andrographis paniculata]